MANRIPLFGTTLKLTISATPTAVPQVVSLDMNLGADFTMIDVTDLDSTSIQNYSGLADFGTLDFKINYDPSDTTHQAIISQAIARGNTVTFLSTFTDTGAATIQTVGPIKSIKFSGGNHAGLLQITCSQKINSYTITP
jgi:hypothetical protein